MRIQVCQFDELRKESLESDILAVEHFKEDVRGFEAVIKDLAASNLRLQMHISSLECDARALKIYSRSLEREIRQLKKDKNRWRRSQRFKNFWAFSFFLLLSYAVYNRLF